MPSIEKRLDKIEKMLFIVLERIEELEDALRKLGISSTELYLASELATTMSIPAYLALEATRRLVSIFSREELDPISRSILKALSICDKLSVSEITRRVRAFRGRASRRIIREKLRILEEKGYVINVGNDKRPLYMLKACMSRSGYSNV